jgi:hypothetical protein
MTRADKIAKFIKENNPRRKDIVRFIVCTLNGVCESHYDQFKRDYRGYYSVAFQRWNYNQKVKKDPITQKYSVTKYYERDGKLYAMPLEVALEYSKKRGDYLLKLYGETNRALIREQAKNQSLLKHI